MSDPHRPVLLAVDVGLRTGYAEFNCHGRLLRYASRRYPSRRVLKRRAYGILRERPQLEWLVAEGGGELLVIWENAAAKLGIRTIATSAENWREELLYRREQRSGQDAKKYADTLARQVIEWSDCKRPTSLRHDAAEAILAGLWGCLQTGLLARIPDDIR